MERKLAYPVPEEYLKKAGKDWENKTFISITGWFAEECNPLFPENNAVAFGGYLMLSKKDGSFNGYLIDPFGIAEIRGMLKEESLTIVKNYTVSTYIPPSSLAVYVLTKNGEGFEGHYEFLQENGVKYWGDAFCKLCPVVQNAFGIAYRPLPKRR